MSDTAISVVLPVHNNAGSLPELCRRLRTSLREGELQIIVVDDCSSDESADVARGLEVELIQHGKNRGQNAALLTGIRRASNAVVVVMDADLQDQPEFVPRLTRVLLDEGLDVVFSTRGGSGGLSSRLFRISMKILYPGLPLGACLHFACTLEFARRVAGIADERDYLVAVMGTLKPSARMVGVERGQRVHGQTSYPGWRRVRHAARLFLASLQRRLIGARTRGRGHDHAIGPDRG